MGHQKEVKEWEIRKSSKVKLELKKKTEEIRFLAGVLPIDLSD